MIREFAHADEEAIRNLGVYLNDSFDIAKISENEKVLVYETDSNIRGFIVFSVVYEVADLTYIVVHPDYRKKGIGKSLLSELLKIQEIEKIMLEVRVSNKEAINFYLKNGFVSVRTIKNYYADGEDAISMERSNI